MKTAYPHLNLTKAQLKSIFDHIDLDNDGTISKTEMEKFLHVLIHEQKDIIFKMDGDESKNDFILLKREGVTNWKTSAL